MFCDPRAVKSCGRIQAVIIFYIVLLPCLSFSAELINTIQIGSHLTEDGSKRHYRSVLEILKEKERDYLRIEKIGNYYALRLGSFADPSEAEDLLRTVKSYFPEAEIMTAYVNNNRLVKIHRSTPTGEPVSALPESKIVPAENPVKEKLDLQPAEADKTASETIAVAKAFTTGGAKVDLPESGAAEETAAMVTGTQSVISDNLLLTFVTAVFLVMLGFYVQALARLGTFASFLEPLAGAEDAEGSTKKDGPGSTEAGAELSIAAPAAAKDLLEAEWPDQTAGGSVEDEQGTRPTEAAVAAKSLAEVAVDERETADENPAAAGTAPTSPQSRVWAKRRAEGPDSAGMPTAEAAELIDQAEIEATQREQDIPAASGTLSTNLTDVEPADDRVESPVRQEKGNRVRNAVEAAMLAAESKRH